VFLYLSPSLSPPMSMGAGTSTSRCIFDRTNGLRRCGQASRKRGLTEEERNLVDLKGASRRSCRPELMKQNRTWYCNFVAGHGTHGDANLPGRNPHESDRQPV